MATKSTRYQGLFCIIACFFCLLLSEAGYSKTTTILALGDSLTLGASYVSPKIHYIPGGYRTELVSYLTQYGASISVIGPKQDNPSLSLIQSQQINHAGFGGYRLDQIDANLDANQISDWPTNAGGFWLTGIPGLRPALYPDIILLMAGTNDLYQDDNVEVIIHRMRHLLDKLTTLRPKARILVAKIPPFFIPVILSNNIQRIQQAKQNEEKYNTALEQLVADYRHKSKHIYLVDQFLPYIYSQEHFIDGVHPDEYVYNLMGRLWAEKIIAFKLL